MTEAERKRLSELLTKLYNTLRWYPDRDEQRQLLAEARAIVDQPC